MGSIGAQYALCEKCNGLFANLETASQHTKACEGDIAVTVCELVACTKDVYMKYVRPQVSRNRRNAQKRTASNEAVPCEKAAKSSKEESTSSSIEKVTPIVVIPRRYGLRKGASEALHTKLSSLTRQLGVRGKVEDRTRHSASPPPTDTTLTTQSDGQSKQNTQPEPTEKAESESDKSENDDDSNVAKVCAQEQDLVMSQDDADSNGDYTAICDVTATKHVATQKEPPPQSSNSKLQKAPGSRSGPPDLDMNRTDSLTHVLNSEHSPVDDSTKPQEHAYSTNETIDDTENMDRVRRESTSDVNGEKGSEKVVSEVRTSKRLRLRTKDTPLKVKEPMECAEPDAEGWYHCTLCPYKSVKQGMFRRHMGAHNDGQMYTCEFCCATFAYQRLYKQHLGTHKGFKCDICGKVFTRRHDRTRHIEATHTGTKKYACGVCGYECRHHHMLTDHQRKHTNERYQCPHKPCGFETIYRRALMHHMSTVHNDQKHLICDTCGYKTNDRITFSKHKKVHNSDKIYGCGLCDYRAHSLSYVTMHMACHSQEKLYRCDQCDYSSVRRTGIRSHMMKHIGVKPWQCPHCEYSATTRTKAQRHISMRHKGGGQPQRRNITIKFDLNAYKIDSGRVEGLSENQGGASGEGEGGAVAGGAQEESGEGPPPGYKYMVIEMVDDSDGTSLTSNLVGQEVVVREETEDSHSATEGMGEASITSMDTGNKTLEGEGQEEGESGMCLYKCALCDMTHSALEVVQDHMANDHPDLIAAQLVVDAAASQSVPSDSVTDPVLDTEHVAATHSMQSNVLTDSMDKNAITDSIQAHPTIPTLQNDKENLQVECVPVNALEDTGDMGRETRIRAVGDEEVTCIFEAGPGDEHQVAQVIEVVQPLAYPGQTLTMQDDAVSTAVESILHLQHVPVKDDGT